MNDTVFVNIWGQRAGTLYWESYRGFAWFEFEKKFLSNGYDIAPVMMPLASSRDKVYWFTENRNKCFNGLPGLVSDSLPDAFGNQIIDQWIQSSGIPVEQFSPLDRLCYVGMRAMGALEFEPSRPIEGLDKTSIIYIDQLSALAKVVLNDREEFSANLKSGNPDVMDILKVGTSAGGAKPKAIIAYNALTGEVRSGQVTAPKGFEYYLLKFDGAEDVKLGDNPRGIGRIEYAYYQMAKGCGIAMSDSRLMKDGENYHFMTKRFDRSTQGEKLHTQTLAAIAHLNRDQLHSYERAFQVMRKLHLPYGEQEEFFRRMVFNVMARNHDDHTKNHSFIMDIKGEWHLSPCYDLCYSYSPSGYWTRQHQMSLNMKRENFVHQDLTAVAQNAGIKGYKGIIEHVADVVSRWKEYAMDAGVLEEHIGLIDSNLILLTEGKSKGWDITMGMS